MRRIALMPFALCLSCAALAEPALPPGLSPYPHAQQVAAVERGDAERFYPLSPLRRISNQARAEQRLDVEGALSALTFQLPAGHTANEAFERARRELAGGAELLYWCEGRDCGAASLWANQVFGRAELSAPDEQQAFALLHPNAAPDTLVALYGVTRANRRAYLHIEQLRAATELGRLLPTPATLLRQLRADGRLALAQWPAEPGEPWLELLRRTLRLDSTLRVRLGGSGAQAWAAALAEQGIRAQRLEAQASEVPGLILERLP